MLPVTAIAIALVAPVPKMSLKVELTTKEALAVRRAITDHSIGIGYNRRLLKEQANISQDVIDMYQQKPSAVLDLLLKIAEVCEPTCSHRAAVSIWVLTGNPSDGVLLLRSFSLKKYDEYNEEDDDTQREHFLRMVRERLKK